jgi:phosphoglucan,water dikinase
MGVAHAATTLRALLLRALSSGLRNDAPDASLAMRQRYRLAELRCEEYLFVLMSRFINGLETQVRRGCPGWVFLGWSVMELGGRAGRMVGLK